MFLTHSPRYLIFSEIFCIAVLKPKGSRGTNVVHLHVRLLWSRTVEPPPGPTRRWLRSQASTSDLPRSPPPGPTRLPSGSLTTTSLTPVSVHHFTEVVLLYLWTLFMTRLKKSQRLKNFVFFLTWLLGGQERSLLSLSGTVERPRSDSVWSVGQVHYFYRCSSCHRRVPCTFSSTHTSDTTWMSVSTGTVGVDSCIR